MISKQNIYFKNLNAIRFFAAFLVIIAHIEGYKKVFNLPNIFSSVMLFGELGVILFFVLSGFLITYLMLIEEANTTAINVKNFYIRRILRIWPLYFLIICLAFFIIPHIGFFNVPGWEQEKIYPNMLLQAILLFLFLPNLLAPIYGLAPGTNQLWSIGVEEQFYLFWPIFFSRIKKHRFLACASLVILYVTIRFILYHLPFVPYQKVILSFWEHFNIDCMAIGAMFAIVHFSNKTLLLKFLYRPAVQWSVLTLTLLCLFSNYKVSQSYYQEFFAVLFGILILNFATNPKPILNMENKFTNYLGKISYGLYMYHMLVVIFSINLLLRLNIASDFILYPLVISMSVGISALSYSFIEKWFMKLKMNYYNVKSAVDANEPNILISIHQDELLKKNRA